MVKDVLRETILADPGLVLDDRDMIRALIGANEDIGGNVVDLRSVLIRRLEGKLDQLEDTHRDVVSAAYENLAGTHQIHRAVLAVLEPPSFDTFLQTIEGDLPRIMALDAIHLCIEGDGVRAGQALGPEGPLRRTIIGLPTGGAAAYCGEMEAPSGRPVILRRTTRAANLIYGTSAGSIASEAVLKLDLGAGRRPGLLVLGAASPARFNQEQGTDLLAFFAAAFAKVTEKWLD